MKVCKNCAAQLPDEAVFCTQCKIPYEQSTQNDFDLERTNLLSDEVESISTNELLTALLKSTVQLIPTAV